MKAYFLLLGAVLALTRLAAAQNAAPAPPSSVHLMVPASKHWTDSKLDVHAGDSVAVSTDSAPKDCPLYARVGADGQVFQVLAGQAIHAASGGRLFLGSNAASNQACKGDFSTQIQVTAGKTGMSVQQKLANAAQTWLSGQFGTVPPTNTPANSAAADTPGWNPAQQVANLALSKTPLDPALTKSIDGLPRRVYDEFHNPGDMVNFVMVASKDQLQKDLADADWHLADTNNAQAVVNAVLQTYKKEDYVAMPMSQLQLFGRFQDFGYEQADPYAVVASQHHFRLWKAPFDYKGQTVWIGAGTHDVGFEKDQRNGSVTHKIDPNVDGERDHIAATLQQAGKVAGMSYYLPSNPVQEAKNATGGGYHSDGKIIVLFLK